jgi:Domain of Unknown Function (DUF1206)
MTTSTFATGDVSERVQDVAHRHPSLVTAARFGWIAKGVVYALVGVLAVPIAIQGLQADRARDRGTQASQLGAVTEIGQNSVGTIALWIIAIGLALYVLWRLVSIMLPADNSAKAWVTRAGYLISALTYALLAWTAVSFALNARSANGKNTEDAKVERFTRDLMDMTAGRWLVGAIGVGVIGAGIYFLIKGVRASFRDELEPAGVGPVPHETIVTLGRVGWIGRGIVMGLVGWFLIRAAVEFRPSEAKGFDGSLREVTETAIGPFIVGVAAVGLIVYGLFCVISAPRQRLKGAD